MGASIPVSPLGSPPASDSEFKIYSSKPAVRFLSRGVQPPSSVYIDISDVLQVGCATTLNGEAVTISYRVLRADGQLVKGQFQLFPTSTRAVVTKQEPLPEGFLLSVSCKANQATSRGQTFVRVFLTDPVLGAGFPSYMLMADYVTTAMAPAHPNGRVLTPVEGPGNLTSVIAQTPPPGNDWTITTPANTRWKIFQTSSSLTTSAVVANRLISLQGFIFGDATFVGEATVAIPASSFKVVESWPSTPYAPIDTTHVLVCQQPELYMRSGNILQSFTVGLQGADAWGGIALLIEEWLDNV